MKALFIWDSDYPWDIRVEKISTTLIDSGWEVHLVCRNSFRRPVEEFYEGINLHRITFLPEKLGSLNDVFSFPAFFSPIWLARISKVAKQHCVDLIIVRDLPMALTAIIVGKKQKIPIFIDMAECYPELIRLIWKFEPFKIANIFVRNPFIVDVVERFALKWADHIFVMVEESKNRLINKGISTDKVTIVSNTPVSGRFKKANPTFPGILQKNRGKLIILYVGFVNFSRGLDTVIESLADYTEINNEFFLVVLGTGSAERNLQKIVKRLSLESYVGFEGWVDNKLIPEYVASSDICLVPHHKCGHWDHTIPNKLFDYMAAGKAILVSNVDPMKRIVQQADCGLIYEDRNKDSFVAQLSRLQDPDLRKKLGLHGVKAVEKEYNWSIDSARMVNTFQRFLN
jgi:glycosyltransferase involved in cell wall biosynthesis